MNLFSSEAPNELSNSNLTSVVQWVNNIHESILPNSEDNLVDHAPYLKMEFESEAVAYEFYNEYSRRIGFGIRR